jgi:hypothetical protein
LNNNLNMSNRADGKTNFSSHPVRSFESNIFYQDHFKIYTIIRTYLINNSNNRVIITPELSKRDVFDYSNHSFIKIIKVSGYILDDTVNDNDVFETLYKFFENIFIELELKELHFVYKSFNEIFLAQETSYKIFKNEKKNNLS